MKSRILAACAAAVLAVGGALGVAASAAASPSPRVPDGYELAALGCLTADLTSEFLSIDLDTGTDAAAVTSTGTITADGLTACLLQGDYSPDQTTVYTIGNVGGSNALISVDVATGVATSRAAFAAGPMLIIGVAVAPDGTIYAVGWNGIDGEIDSVDRLTGALTPVIPSVGLAVTSALTVDPDTGLLYGVTTDGAVVRYDLQTLSATIIGSLGVTTAPPAASIQIAGGRLWYYSPTTTSGPAELVTATLADVSGTVMSLGQLATDSSQPIPTSLLLRRTSPLPATGTTTTAVTPVDAATTSGAASAASAPTLAETGVDGTVFGIYGAGALVALLAGIAAVVLERRRRDA